MYFLDEKQRILFDMFILIPGISCYLIYLFDKYRER